MSEKARQAQKARDAMDLAERGNWSPYSEFVVVAAVETVDGRIYGGSNVECVNYTLTKHAEETATLAAIADGAIERCSRKFIKRVYIDGGIPPCGGCRQFLHEFAADDAEVVLDTRRVHLSALLPAPFGPDQLGVTL